MSRVLTLYWEGFSNSNHLLKKLEVRVIGTIKSKVVRLSREVIEYLEAQEQTLGESSDAVLRRCLGLPAAKPRAKKKIVRKEHRERKQRVFKYDLSGMGIGDRLVFSFNYNHHAVRRSIKRYEKKSGRAFYLDWTYDGMLVTRILWVQVICYYCWYLFSLCCWWAQLVIRRIYA